MIFEKLKDMIVDQLGISRDKIKLDSNIFDDLGADSLDIVEMLMEIESEWDIIIDDDDTTSLKTVGDVVKYIEERKK